MEIQQAMRRIQELEKEVLVSDKLIEERNELLEEIPHCVAHGLCVPHALEWVRQVKTLARVVVGGG